MFEAPKTYVLATEDALEWCMSEVYLQLGESIYRREARKIVHICYPATQYCMRQAIDWDSGSVATTTA